MFGGREREAGLGEERGRGRRGFAATDDAVGAANTPLRAILNQSSLSSLRPLSPTPIPQENYGIGQGNTINMALPKRVELPPGVTYEEFLESTAAARRTLQLAAARDLTNISADERARRGRAGRAMLAASAALAAAAVALHLAPGARAALVGVPFWLGYSLAESQRQGICSIAQAGAWDVDGCGLQYIEDATLAGKIRAKVNNMYVQSVAVAGAVAGAFALLPLPQ